LAIWGFLLFKIGHLFAGGKYLYRFCPVNSDSPFLYRLLDVEKALKKPNLSKKRSNATAIPDNVAIVRKWRE